jgi:hypothetical protein
MGQQSSADFAGVEIAVRKQPEMSKLHYDANCRAAIGVRNGAIRAMALEDMLLEGRAPQVMRVAGIHIRRRWVHDQEFMTEGTLPSHSAVASEECEVISHVASIKRRPLARNLQW